MMLWNRKSTMKDRAKEGAPALSGAGGSGRLLGRMPLAERLNRKLSETKGQGTTEYAILVGVLVVIAILAIGLFRGNLQNLWNAIAEGINGL